MVIIDPSTISREMEEVTDEKTIATLEKILCLDALSETADPNTKKNPIVFGSITNWKPMQSIKLSQYVCATASRSENERRILS